METSARWAAFSLLEMNITLLIVALMVGFSVQAYQSQDDEACVMQVAEQINTLQATLETFARGQGRYPLPAGRSLKPSDSDFGREVPSGGDSRIHRIAGANPILVGAVPHATLGLGNDAASDCWGHKITYAVTESLTSTAGFASAGTVGGIVLNRGSLSASHMLNNKIAYVLISHGRDGLGASNYSYGGALKTCNAAQASGTYRHIDKENCDTANAVFYASDYNDQDTTDSNGAYYDDLIAYGEKPVAIPVDCDAGVVTWGGGCSAPSLITLAGLSVTLTDLTPPFTGVAISTCNNGVRNNVLVGLCLP